MSKVGSVFKVERNRENDSYYVVKVKPDGFERRIAYCTFYFDACTVCLALKDFEQTDDERASGSESGKPMKLHLVESR